MLIAQVISNPCPDWVPEWWCLLGLGPRAVMVLVAWVALSLAFGSAWGYCGFMWNRRRPS